MLKPAELKALSNKLNFNNRTTKHCLKDVFSINSPVINQGIVTKKDVIEFLRICAFSKTKEERIEKVSRIFLPRFMKKPSPKETVIYFIRDYFFSSMLEFLDRIEGIKFRQSFAHVELDNESTFYFTMIGTEYMNYCYLNQRRSMVAGYILEQIMDSVDLGNDDFRLTLEKNYIVNLCSEIVQEIGYQAFLVDLIRDVFVDYQEMGSFKPGLIKTSEGLVLHNKKKRTDYVFIYCLCESLRESGFKAEDIYKKISGIIWRDSKSVRRRYYGIKSEVEKKGLNYKSLIKTHNLQLRIFETIREIESSQ